MKSKLPKAETEAPLSYTDFLIKYAGPIEETLGSIPECAKLMEAVKASSLPQKLKVSIVQALKLHRANLSDGIG